MDQRKVETIQCIATKLITSLQDSDHGTGLAELRLSLNYCCQRGVMIYLYQIFNSLVDIDVNDLFT